MIIDAETEGQWPSQHDFRRSESPAGPGPLASPRGMVRAYRCMRAEHRISLEEGSMAVKVQVSEEIERPVPVVFKFDADEHVRNHPRWDPNIELWLEQDAPIGVGTIIRRRNRRSGTPVEGTMEIIEFERDKAIAALTHDGPLEIRGRATFENLGRS